MPKCPECDASVGRQDAACKSCGAELGEMAPPPPPAQPSNAQQYGIIIGVIVVVVAHLFDERNPAVKRLVADVIRRARACGRKVGICGQAPSDYPEFARFLVECGIDSISLNPDTVIRTTRDLLEVEKALAQAHAESPAGCELGALRQQERLPQRDECCPV